MVKPGIGGQSAIKWENKNLRNDYENCGEQGGEGEETGIFMQEPIPNSDDVYEEIVAGDIGIALVTRRSCITPRAANDDWLRNNIFQSTCTILNKVCRFLIDAGSCENIVSEDVIIKLGIATKPCLRPYKLAWLKRGGELTVSSRALISFSIGTKYQDSVWCDIVPMDACHLLLGRP
mgnify:CR=1 FL=1